MAHRCRAAVFVSAASAANLPLGDDDGWLCALPLAHAGGLMIPIRCLVAGRAVVAAPHLEVSTLREAVDGRGATIASLVPTMLARLLEAGAAGMLRRLRAILLGGDAAPPRLLETCRAERLPVLCTYGLTETAGQVATQSPDEPAEPAAGVGRPLPGVEVRVADGGHILVRGPTVASALLGEPPRPADDWLDTGDLGHLDPRGRLHVTGRAGDVMVAGTTPTATPVSPST